MEDTKRKTRWENVAWVRPVSADRLPFSSSSRSMILRGRLVHRRRGACHADADGGQVVFNASTVRAALVSMAPFEVCRRAIASALWRRCGSYQPSMQRNSASRAWAFTRKSRRSIRSHSKVAKKPPTIALS